MYARSLGAALMALAFISLAAVAPAIAQTTTAVVAATPAASQNVSSIAIPIGQWIGDFATFALPIIAAAVAWALRKLPANLQAILKTMQAEQLIGMAINYGLNAVAGAEKGKVLNVNTGNSVANEALSYVLAHGAGSLIDWLGGEAAVQQKIIARLSLGSDAQVVAAPGGYVSVASSTPTPAVSTVAAAPAVAVAPAIQSAPVAATPVAVAPAAT